MSASQAVSTDSAPANPPPGDWRLLKAELRACAAYVNTLVGPGILGEGERDALLRALKQIEDELGRGAFKPEGDDPFSALDSRLLEIDAGAAAKLNAARSRNEQTVTALRLWLLEELETIGGSLADVQRALIQQAESQVAALMPGYTHMQPAGVVSASHWLMSFFWMLARDQDRLAGVIGRTSISPMGSGALAGIPYPVDRSALAEALGFSDISRNSMDAVGDLDFAAEFLFTAALIGIHLSRLAEDIVFYSNPALGFVTVDEAYTTRSTLIPNKHNPIAVERARGKAGGLLGDLTGFLAILKGLPSTYNQDVQESRAGLYRAVEVLRDLLDVMEGVILTLDFHPDTMQKALDERMLLTDLADYLVARGVAYREAYRVVERLAEEAHTAGKALSELPMSAYQAASSAFDADLFAVFDYSRSVARRTAVGGTAPAAVRKQIRHALDWMMENGLE